MNRNKLISTAVGIAAIGGAIGVGLFVSSAVRRATAVDGPWVDVSTSVAPSGLVSARPSASWAASPDCVAACRLRGACEGPAYGCTATRVEHCERSDNCREFGDCGFDGKHCRPTRAEHCTRSLRCQQLGACGMRDGRCSPTRAAHCQASRVCREQGMCRLLKAGESFPPECGLTSHAECRASALCKNEGRCLRAPLDAATGGTCVKTVLVSRQTFPLRRDRHGVDGELRILTDERFERSRDRDNYRGYHWSDETPPLAAAVAQVRSDGGEPVHELELWPAVHVVVADLGDGTDTFLTTQEFGCAAGRYCGWDTLFLQVHGRRVAPLRAVAAGGEQEPIDLTASEGTSWKLEAVSSGRDIVARRIGAMDTVETRYYFWNGAWRLVRASVAHVESREPSARRPPEHR